LRKSFTAFTRSKKSFSGMTVSGIARRIPVLPRFSRAGRVIPTQSQVASPAAGRHIMLLRYSRLLNQSWSSSTAILIKSHSTRNASMSLHIWVSNHPPRRNKTVSPTQVQAFALPNAPIVGLFYSSLRRFCAPTDQKSAFNLGTYSCQPPARLTRRLKIGTLNRPASFARID